MSLLVLVEKSQAWQPQNKTDPNRASPILIEQIEPKLFSEAWTTGRLGDLAILRPLEKKDVFD